MTPKVALSCSINGVQVCHDIDPRLLLPEFVRDVAGLRGTRMGCLTGDCGACTLRIDGKIIKSCLVLAVAAEGREIVTIEGATDLDVIQKAFVAEYGFQCGFCTNGMVFAAGELLRDNPDANDADIRRAISGNLCRCTGYDAIVAAIRCASEKQGQSSIHGTCPESG